MGSYNMSLTLNCKVNKEPYYAQLIEQGYKYLGQGYMHVVFEKDGIVYKVVRSKFRNFDKKFDYEFEKNMLDMLRKHNLPTPNVIKIYDKGNLLKDFYVLSEEKIPGIIKNKETLTVDDVNEIISIREKANAITFPFFGQLYDKKLQFKTWQEYMMYLIERAKKAALLFKLDFDAQEVKNYFSKHYVYKGAPCFLLLDPNEENFVFDEHGKVAGLIDIDHPMCFDPLYEYAICLYAKKYIFNMMRKIKKYYINNNIEIIKKYAIVHSLADILFLYDKDKSFFSKEIEHCAKYVAEFHNFLQDYR